MASQDVGTIILSVDGQDYDCTKFTSKKTTGWKPKPTMNRTGKVRYVTKGVSSYELTASVVIPNGKDRDWMAVEGARISIESESGDFRESYIDCYVQDVSDSYAVEGETTRDLTLFALDYIEE